MGVYIKGLSKDQFDIIVGSVFKFPKGVIDVQEPHGELIDADELKKHFSTEADEFMMSGNMDWSFAYGSAASEVSHAPTVIPAEENIPKCKDCKHYNEGFKCPIEWCGIERDKNWYRADAERKTTVR
jgi:hypothetical protein